MRTTTLDINAGSIEITATGYRMNDGTEIPYTGVYTITGMTDTNIIRVTGGTHTITLNRVNINVGSLDNMCAFAIKRGTVNLTLNGKNILQSSENIEGLQVENSQSLVIAVESTGTLTVNGEMYGSSAMYTSVRVEDDIFMSSITVGSYTAVPCTFKILTEPSGDENGTVQVGRGTLVDGSYAAIPADASGQITIPNSMDGFLNRDIQR